MAETEVRGSTQIKDLSIGNLQIATAAAIETTKLADGSKFIQSDGSVAWTADQSHGNNRITSVADPTSAQDAATKAYVDGIAGGFDFKEAVRVATAANIADLAAGAPDTVDGVSLAVGNRILVKDQSTGSQNGLYKVDTVGTGSNGAWSRTADADTSAEVTAGMFVIVNEGTVNGDTQWLLTTNDPITLDTTALVFSLFGRGDSAYWRLLGRPGGQIGNGGTDANDDAEINSTTHPTKGVVRLQSAGGFVVIGTGTATSVFHIFGPDDGDAEIRLQKGSNLVARLGTGSATAGEESGLLQLLDNAGNTDVQLWTEGDSWFNGGDLGVGTTTPGAPLDVHVASAGAIRLTDKANSGSAARVWFEFYDSAATRHGYIGIANPNSLFVWQQLSGDIRLGTNNLERVRIDSAGLVGINKSGPGAQTHIVSSAVGTVGLRVDTAASPTASAATFYNNATLAHDLAVKAGGIVVFNEAGIDLDFRIEGDNLTNLLRVDADVDRVAIGHATPDRLFHVELDDASTNTVLYPVRIARTSSAAPANGIGAGVEFEVETAAGNNEVGAIIEATAFDTTATSEDFRLRFGVMTAGAAATPSVYIDGNGLGIGATPGQALTVAGSSKITGGYIAVENSSVPYAPGAAEGLFWVKNDSPNTPYFTDDAGTDHALITGATVTTNMATREVPGGAIDSVNTTYTLANTPTSGTEELYLNGVLQNAGVGNDYTISGLTITMAAAPVTGDVLLCTYWY